jgi:alginate O-acetyltransferase complex protein AlgI
LTFDLRAIVIFCLAALIYAGLLPARWRTWALLAGSVLAIYWLQPALPVRFSGYVLPTATLALTIASWWFTRKPNDPDQSRTLREDRITLGVIVALAVGLSFLRFVEAEYRVIATRPPDPLAVLVALAIVGTALAGLTRLLRRANQQAVMTGGIVLIAALFVLLKTEPLAREISRLWRGLTDQDTALASQLDLDWLGFSYVAFRLIHTFRDRQTGQLPVLSLREYVTYVIFFPAYTAGPIDRAERFATDLRDLSTLQLFDAQRFTTGLTRILLGLLYKFVIADGLAQGASLNATNATQVRSTLWLWVLLYGYALRLFFDFAGYSSIAIGIGILFGIRLPENFDRPYVKTTITAFWQSWHITLSNWARFYVFSPLSRWLLMFKRRPSPTVIVLLAQLATMVTIGLWHGVTVNFIIWGLWHGVALFVHKQWSDRTRKWYRALNDRPWRKCAWTALTWFVTFQYVVIGWVWFAMSDTVQAARPLVQLFGFGW